jgi:hypothetical protein
MTRTLILTLTAALSAFVVSAGAQIADTTHFVPFREPPWLILHPIPLDAAQQQALPAFIAACKAMASRDWTAKTHAEWDVSCENGSRLER